MSERRRAAGETAFGMATSGRKADRFPATLTTARRPNGRAKESGTPTPQFYQDHHHGGCDRHGRACL